MRIRAAQLACLLLLLTSVGAADACVRRTDFSVGGHFVSQLLQHAAVANTEKSLLHRRIAAPYIEPATTVFARSVWTMRPPAAQTVHVHAVTGSGF